MPSFISCLRRMLIVSQLQVDHRNTNNDLCKACWHLLCRWTVRDRSVVVHLLQALLWILVVTCAKPQLQQLPRLLHCPNSVQCLIRSPYSRHPPPNAHQSAGQSMEKDVASSDIQSRIVHRARFDLEQILQFHASQHHGL